MDEYDDALSMAQSVGYDRDGAALAGGRSSVWEEDEVGEGEAQGEISVCG